MNADEYRVGEKYRYHIKGENIHSYRDASDKDVQEGREFFTKAFGVRVTSIKHMDALEVGIDSYYAQPNTGDIPREAVNRAVLLKKTYFPETKWKWNVDDFNRIPYAAPIPNLKFDAPPLEASDLNLSLPKTGISEENSTPAVQTQQQLSSAASTLSNKVASPNGDVIVSFFQKAKVYTKKNWWLILLPLPVAAIVVIIKHHKK